MTELAPNPPAPGASWRPTKKWVAGLVTGLAAVAGTWLISGDFNGPEKAQLAALLLAQAGSYFKSNDATPGGVPESS